MLMPGADENIISVPFSAIIIVGELVFPDVIVGITDASITLNPSKPFTLQKINLKLLLVIMIQQLV